MIELKYHDFLLQQKQKLQESITTALQEFESKTGLQAREINVIEGPSYGGKAIILGVELSIKVK